MSSHVTQVNVLLMTFNDVSQAIFSLIVRLLTDLYLHIVVIIYEVHVFKLAVMQYKFDEDYEAGQKNIRL